MQTIKSIQNLKNKKVLVRVGFNVPTGDDGVVDDKEDWRIKAALPMIEYLLEKKAKIILISHLGRPETNWEITLNVAMDSRLRGNDNVVKYSLKPIADRLRELLNCKIKFVNNCIGNEVEDAVGKMRAGEIILLENLRFYKGEENNDIEFAKKLAELADLYINNAFSVSHRKHASVVAITKFLPSYAGLLLEKEIKILSEAINNPKRPATIIIGGAKAKTKLPVVKFLMNKFDYLLIGGVVANAILKAKGVDTGKSLSGNVDSKDAKKINLDSNKLYTPLDAIVCNSKIRKVELSSIGKIGDKKILDIGSDTVELFLKIIADSKTIIWNGPMGMFEKKEFSDGTRKITEAIVKSREYTIIGGGDTIAAVDKFGRVDNIDYICTGGGAMLEFLAGKKLPGIEALK